MILSSSPKDAPSLRWMVVSVVVTTRMSRPTISDATDVSASTQRCFATAGRLLAVVVTIPSDPRSGPGIRSRSAHRYVPAGGEKFTGWTVRGLLDDGQMA